MIENLQIALKTRQSPEAELRDQLILQLRFLSSSATTYDRGEWWEGRRIAGPLRVLLHNTSKSKSLLSQLGLADLLLTSFVSEADLKTYAAGTGHYHFGAPLAIMSSDECGKPLLKPYSTWGFPNHATLRTIPEWWTDRIGWAQQEAVTRREIVLGAANKDGIAHVDLERSVAYDELKNFGSGRSNVIYYGAPEAALRTMVEELITSPGLGEFWKEAGISINWRPPDKFGPLGRV